MDDDDDEEEIHLPLHPTLSKEWGSGSNYPVDTTEYEQSFFTLIWNVLYSPFDVCLPIMIYWCPRMSGSGQMGREMTVSLGKCQSLEAMSERSRMSGLLQWNHVHCPERLKGLKLLGKALNSGHV